MQASYMCSLSLGHKIKVLNIFLWVCPIVPTFFHSDRERETRRLALALHLLDQCFCAGMDDLSRIAAVSHLPRFQIPLFSYRLAEEARVWIRAQHVEGVVGHVDVQLSRTSTSTIIKDQRQRGCSQK